MKKDVLSKDFQRGFKDLMLTIAFAKDPRAEMKLREALSNKFRLLPLITTPWPIENRTREWEMELRQKCGNICEQYPKVKFLLKQNYWHHV